MKVTVFSTLAFERPFLEKANAGRHELLFLEAPLNAITVALAQGSEAVCVFASDDLSAPILEQLQAHGVRYVAVRPVGSDNVDLAAAAHLGLRVANAPDYSPYAVAEHAVLLILALCRHLRQASQQLRANDFHLDDLIGFDLHGKTVGILGVGQIGAVMARILHGFGCKLLGMDVEPNRDLTTQFDLRYVPLPELCAQADIITVHTPLTAKTMHLIDDQLLGEMKYGVLLVNTGRGGVLDTKAALRALDSGQLGYLGLDVYEHEKGLFFGNHSLDQLRDPLYAKLLTYPNVFLTGHQAYLTREALTNIADTVVASLDAWAQGQPAPHQL
ncbi:D-lactate dehydrogenase [Hymenobacter sp. UYAg731]